MTSCDFTNDQKSVVTATFGGRVYVIDLATRERNVDCDLMFLSDDPEEIMCYHVASVKNFPSESENVFVLSSGAGVPIVIDYEGWHEEPLHRLQTVKKYHGHSGPVRHCEFSPDRSKLVSSCADHSLRVWDTDQEITLKTLAGHTDLATAGVWLNENTIVSSSWDLSLIHI